MQHACFHNARRCVPSAREVDAMGGGVDRDGNDLAGICQCFGPLHSGAKIEERGRFARPRGVVRRVMRKIWQWQAHASGTQPARPLSNGRTKEAACRAIARFGCRRWRGRLSWALAANVTVRALEPPAGSAAANGCARGAEWVSMSMARWQSQTARICFTTARIVRAKTKERYMCGPGYNRKCWLLQPPAGFCSDESIINKLANA